MRPLVLAHAEVSNANWPVAPPSVSGSWKAGPVCSVGVAHSSIHPVESSRKAWWSAGLTETNSYWYPPGSSFRPPSPHGPAASQPSQPFGSKFSGTLLPFSLLKASASKARHNGVAHHEVLAFAAVDDFVVGDGAERTCPGEAFPSKLAGESVVCGIAVDRLVFVRVARVGEPAWGICDDDGSARGDRDEARHLFGAAGGGPRLGGVDLPDVLPGGVEDHDPGAQLAFHFFDRGHVHVAGGGAERRLVHVGGRCQAVARACSTGSGRSRRASSGSCLPRPRR